MNTIDEKKIAKQTESEKEIKRVPDDELEGVSGGHNSTVRTARERSKKNK